VTKKLVVIALAAVTWISSGGTSSAQPPAAQASSAQKPAQNVPLEVQVVIARYQGEKRISSLPYVLSLKSSLGSAGFRQPGQGAQLRLGSRVPIRTQVVTPAADGKPATTTNSFSYENVGMNIDAGAVALEDGRFEVTITINESSVVTDPQDLKATPGMGDYPVFRSYQSTNTFFVKDGQTAQFTAATDRVSGEVVRVEVRLRVLK
jgi:hypothetical protein